jgi:tRNA threonylcarbamoyladenosine biosynthesis protein TsaE
MEAFVYDAQGEEATATLGVALAAVLPPAGAVVALCGTLGAGKTRLAQAIAEAYGIRRRDVVSPTFVLVQEHHGRRDVFHIDAYRMRDEDEFEALGPEEYFESDGVTLVEWADRVPACLPKEHLSVDIEVTGAESRQFRITAKGARYDRVIEALAQQLGRHGPAAK